eukprot:SAG31_NODE_17929_length_653_cov_0.745487_1_plen_90_part_00
MVLLNLVRYYFEVLNLVRCVHAVPAGVLRLNVKLVLDLVCRQLSTQLPVQVPGLLGTKFSRLGGFSQKVGTGYKKTNTVRYTFNVVTTY